MARIGTAAENAAVNAVLALAAYGSLHTGDTSTTGANEYSGVTRQASTWASASGGSGANASGETYTTSGATPVTYFGQWSAVTAGTFEFGGALSSSVQAPTITIASGAKALAAS